MAVGKLLFDGHRYPLAQVRAWKEVPYWPGVLPGGRRYAKVEAGGRGRAWSTDKPLGFWRTFTEIGLEETDHVAMIFRRYGDPFGLLPNASDTGGWVGLFACLSAATVAWDAAGPDGISRLTSAPDRLEHARSFMSRFISTNSEPGRILRLAVSCGGP